MPKTIAIMQPYLFPYLGYMHLVNASDIFVFYDDVAFIKQGWINKNRIIINGTPYSFTVPLIEASSYKWIMNTHVKDLAHFKKKFLKQIQQSYRNCKNYSCGIEYIAAVLSEESSCISDIAQKSISKFFELIEIEKSFLKSSELLLPNTDGMTATDRLIAITRHLGGDRYINLMGGIDLYSKEYFSSRNIQLNFILSRFESYDQGNGVEFIPAMSILDLIMRLKPAELREHLSSYELK